MNTRGFCYNNGAVYQSRHLGLSVAVCLNCNELCPEMGTGSKDARSIAKRLGWLVERTVARDPQGMPSKKVVVLCRVCREIPGVQKHMRSRGAGERAVGSGYYQRRGGASVALSADGPQGDPAAEPTPGGTVDGDGGRDRDQPDSPGPGSL